MTGARVAILGLGRSGLSVAKAALQVGANPIVYDEMRADDLKSKEALKELSDAGIEGVAGWDGAFSETKAELVVTSPGVSKKNPRLLRAIEEGLPVLSEIEFAYRISNAPIIAITGTNGKSTTTVMTWLCLKAMGADAVLCGNIYGSGYDEVPLTEAAASSHPNQVLVAEISSFQLEWIEQFRPRAAAITNITPDHLNRYKNFDEYSQTKRLIFSQMGKGDTVVAHSSDPLVQPQNLQDLQVLLFGSEKDDAYQTADDLFILGERISKKDLPWHEPHNYLNAMCAALLASAIPSPITHHPSQIEVGLKQFRGLRHRMESLGVRGGVKVINNSMCTNPGALISSSLSIPNKQRILVGGVNKDLDFTPVKKHLDKTGHSAYLFGQDAEKINAQLGGRWRVFKTMPEAFEAAVADAKSGETILLAPGAASLDQFGDFRERGEAFRKIAMEWLKS